MRQPEPSPTRGSAPTRPAMIEIGEHEKSVTDDLVRLRALDIGDETDAARIMLVGRIVKSLRWRWTDQF